MAEKAESRMINQREAARILEVTPGYLCKHLGKSLRSRKWKNERLYDLSRVLELKDLRDARRSVNTKSKRVSPWSNPLIKETIEKLEEITINNSSLEAIRDSTKKFLNKPTVAPNYNHERPKVTPAPKITSRFPKMSDDEVDSYGNAMPPPTEFE